MTGIRLSLLTLVIIRQLGATQDLTPSLKVMLDRKITNALVVFIVDPVSWKACAGTGVELRLVCVWVGLSRCGMGLH